MNKELIAQFVQQVGTNTGGKWISTSRMDQFTALVVRECHAVILKNSHRDDDMAAIISNKINKHFGVEL